MERRGRGHGKAREEQRLSVFLKKGEALPAAATATSATAAGAAAAEGAGA
jgi:hypothetical protein